MEINIDSLVRDVARKLKDEAVENRSDFREAANEKYPLSQNAFDLKSKTGKKLSEFKYDDLISGKLTHDDFKTDPETLLKQAEIAETAGKKQFADNLRRAAELTLVPDDELLHIYDKLRPNRATKQELKDISENLRKKYNAKITADFISETAEIYEKRKILL